MKPSLQKLQKFFKLEAERGYDNRAVLGGLERMLDLWEAEARADALPEDLVQAVIARVRDYARLTPASRAESLDGLWKRIQRGQDAPPASSPAKKPGFQKPALQREAPAQKAVPPKPAPPPAKSSLPRVPVQSKPVADENDSDLMDEEGLDEIEMEVDAPGGLPDEGNAETAEDALGSWSAPARAPAPAGPPVEPAALNASTTVLPGIGPKHAQSLERLGLRTLRDMLYYFPRRYDDYSQLKPINHLWYGQEVTVIGTVQSVNLRPLKSGKMQVVEVIISDGTGTLRCSWFNQPWLARRLHTGAHVSLSGRVDQYLGRLAMNSPTWEFVNQQQLSTNRIVPVYSLTADITQNSLRRMLNAVVSYYAPRLPDMLPENLRRSAGLMGLGAALTQAHFPDSMDALKAARHRLAFDEIFLLQLGVMRQKRAWNERSALQYPVEDEWLNEQVRRLPFSLTGAQQHALDDVRGDLASGRPMNRLLQGDVGSGKTVIAALAVAIIAQHGAQSALMAPTSILAEQHYKSMLRLLAGQENGKQEAATPEAALPEAAPDATPEFESAQITPEEAEFEPQLQDDQLLPDAAPEPDLPEEQLVEPPPADLPFVDPPLRPEQIRLLVGATPESAKNEIRQGLADGSIKLVIGTHALIEDPVIFQNLQLAIVDEQHRFGVDQRAALRSKGENPHLLVMTATPIPRSLALTVYGDLDLSVMDEMPPGRQPVSTHVLPPRERERAYSLIRSQIAQGRQAFVIYPLVEESEKSDAKAAVEEYHRLQKEVFPRLNLGLLHGRMRPDEKEEVMARFRDRDAHILVSTSVVEVGVDVPNATVMVIEGANHFGLAQLHQFRGRVGRGAEKSYCLLIPDTPDAVENERLQVMAETNDGFVLAEKDLDQRGPGQFLGTRQSGFSELQLASLTDVRLIEKARRFAQELFADDPDLQKPEHQLLSSALHRFWGDSQGDIS